MDEARDNPPANRLGAGLTDEQLRAAVDGSGYPVQTVVAATLRERGFGIAEEWVFSDRDSGQLRALDLYAGRRLYDPGTEGDKRVRPEVALLVECKRSEMPYVFFASETRPGAGGRATRIAGLSEDRIEVRTDDDLSSWSFSTMQLLGLSEHAFVTGPPNVALAFSKATRRNKDLQLSGTDPYQSLVLPLTKALASYAERFAPPKTAVYFDLILPVGVAVIDGPMVVATVSSDDVAYKLAPWVRVYRHDFEPGADHFEREGLYAIDCVHSSWLDSYLDQHLEPFVQEFGRRALPQAEVLATRAGFARGMGRDPWTDISQRVRPRQLADHQPRPALLARNIRSLIEEQLRRRG